MIRYICIHGLSFSRFSSSLSYLLLLYQTENAKTEKSSCEPLVIFLCSFLLGINYDESYQIAKQILKGVDFIHSESYFHRDLKVGRSQDFHCLSTSF